MSEESPPTRQEHLWEFKSGTYGYFQDVEHFYKCRNCGQRIEEAASGGPNMSRLERLEECDSAAIRLVTES